MSIEYHTGVYCGYKLPYDTVKTLTEYQFEELTDNDLLHVVNCWCGHDETDYILGREMSSVQEGDCIDISQLSIDRSVYDEIKRIAKLYNLMPPGRNPTILVTLQVY